MEKLKIQLFPPFVKGMFVAFVISFLGAICISACEDTYIGKSKEEIQIELAQAMWEADSIILSIQYMLDSSTVDGTYYINSQRINNGSD